MGIEERSGNDIVRQSSKKTSGDSEHIKIRCACGVGLKIPPKAVGKKIKCPKCGKVFVAEEKDSPLELKPLDTSHEEFLSERQELEVPNLPLTQAPNDASTERHTLLKAFRAWARQTRLERSFEAWREWAFKTRNGRISRFSLMFCLFGIAAWGALFSKPRATKITAQESDAREKRRDEIRLNALATREDEKSKQRREEDSRVREKIQEISCEALAELVLQGSLTDVDKTFRTARFNLYTWLQLDAEQKTFVVKAFSDCCGGIGVTIYSNLNDQELGTYSIWSGVKIVR